MLLATFDVRDRHFRIESTTHAYQRMNERNINKNTVVSVLKNLNSKILIYNNTGEEIAVIDQQNDIAIISEVRYYKIVIITVINRSNIHIKEGTRMEEIA